MSKKTEQTPPSLALLKKWEDQDREDVIIREPEQLPENELDYDRMNILAKAYSQTNHYGRAIPYLLRYEERGRDDSLWNWRMGLCLVETGKSKDAVHYLERAIGLGDDYAETKAYLNKARIRAEAGEIEKVTMTVEEVKDILKRKAVVFQTGGKRPVEELLESRIGSVCYKREDEGVPLDRAGDEMLPIATVFLKGLPFCPAELTGIELITVFMSDKVWDNLVTEDLGSWFSVRTYRSLDDLVSCEYTSDLMKPFPLIPQLVENDYPTWDGGSIPPEIEDIIVEMEKEDVTEYYGGIHEETYATHKIGGYPAFCQPGHGFGEGYPFVMQISSDVKADFNVVDNGNFYFYYNADRDDWKVYCDFY